MQSYHRVHVQLGRKDRQQLAGMLTKGWESARVLRRASILRQLDQGQKAAQVATNVGVAAKTVRAVARRYEEQGLEPALYEKPRPGPTAGKHDALLLAIVPQHLVHEGTVVVRIQPQQRKRYLLAQAGNSFDDESLFTHGKRDTLGPARCHVGQDQTMHEASFCPRPAMRDQIHFHEAGTKRFLPVGEGADRNHLTHTVRRRRSLLMPSTGSLSDKVKLTIYRGGTHRKQLGPYPLFQLQMPVSLHGFHQQRQ